MAKETKILCWLVVFVVIATLGFWGYRFCTRGVRICITNQSKSIVKTVELNYTGGVVRIGNLEPGQSRIVYVNPKGESALELSWSDDTGGHHQYIDTYIEHNYGGRGEIILLGNAEIKWVDNIKIDCLF